MHFNTYRRGVLFFFSQAIETVVIKFKLSNADNKCFKSIYTEVCTLSKKKKPRVEDPAPASTFHR